MCAVLDTTRPLAFSRNATGRAEHLLNTNKLEQFVFDAIPLARNAIVYTTRREEEFSPVKNAEGDDSPATCRRDQIRRSAAWLEFAGVKVERAGSEPCSTLEISPLFATGAAQLKSRNIPFNSIKCGETVYFDEAGPVKA